MDTVITVRVIPRSGKPGPAGIRGDAYLIRLNAPPIEGAANIELIELLADLFDLPMRNVSIIAGERSRSKRVRIEGRSEQEVKAALLR